MKIQYASDLHLEFVQNAYFLNSNKLIPKADILILAGDILPFKKNIAKEKYLDFLSEAFKTVYWLPGNHEYYYSDIIRYHKFGQKEIRPNIELVSNKTISINGVNLIFSVLWGYIQPVNELWIKAHVSDFSCIHYNGDDFRPYHFNKLHESCKQFLTNELENHQGEKNVVITHHVPTLKNYPEEYKKSIINEAFVIEMFDIIEKYQPEVWIYGHSHVNTPEFMIGKTRLVTNQLGYVEMGEYKTFRLDACIEI